MTSKMSMAGTVFPLRNWPTIRYGACCSESAVTPGRWVN
jgi:hypothetical protein